MDMNDFKQLVRRTFGHGVSGKEEFEMELEAIADKGAREYLEEAEQLDERIAGLRHLAQEPAWYESKLVAMAASVVVAVSLTWLVADSVYRTPMDSGLASSSIYYLEPTRGGAIEDMPVITIEDDGSWITLVTYPAVQGSAEFRVGIDKLTGAQSTGMDLDAASWDHVWESLSLGGGDDGVAVVIKRDLLEPGIYRVNLNRLTRTTDAQPAASISHFRVVDSTGG